MAIFLAGIMSGGCAYRPGNEVLIPVANIPASTDKVDVLVATTRERGSKDDPDEFTVERSKQLNFASLTVSIPPAHVTGEIEWPNGGPPDPALHFVTTRRTSLGEDGFIDELRQRGRRSTEQAGDVLVFIHGYNTRYEEAVYWLAQIVHDSGFKGTAVLFAWPSRGKAPLYLADREASTYSRDYFERALLKISKVPEVKEINILAHSMGNWLAVEGLRQAKMNGHGDFGGKLGEVILASPDLDANVFRTQLDVIGKLPRPMTVLVSGDDKALALSTWLAGDVERAGMITADDARAVAAAERYNLKVVDLTAVDDGKGNHHSKYSKSAPVIAAIGSKLKNPTASTTQVGVVTAVTNAGDTLLKVPASILPAANAAQ
ncbi:MAG: esterase [Hyphomicrobium sp.]|nr:esterase [Hyphomicrobium sp.]PPD08554.1 MAG: esterase [Hyphomicrobium sp.]